jgi:hypothetical protein
MAFLATNSFQRYLLMVITNEEINILKGILEEKNHKETNKKGTISEPIKHLLDGQLIIGEFHEHCGLCKGWINFKEDFVGLFPQKMYNFSV